MRSGPWPQSASPLRQSFGLLGGELRPREAGRHGLLLVHPGQEVLRGQIREGEQQVGQIALGVDGDHRDVVDQRLLEQAERQAGLAAAGHADDDGVGGQVLGVVQDQFLSELSGVHVECLAQVKNAELFVIRHGALPFCEPSCRCYLLGIHNRCSCGSQRPPGARGFSRTFRENFSALTLARSKSSGSVDSHIGPLGSASAWTAAIFSRPSQRQQGRSDIDRKPRKTEPHDRDGRRCL